MSAPELEPQPEPRRDYGTIIVVGGGCYGSYYVTQLRRAQAATALHYRGIVVVDRDPTCSVGMHQVGSDVRLECDDWSAFFDHYLAQSSGDSIDAIVPSPLMPHLMYQWLLRRAMARWPGRLVETRPLMASPDVPWQRAAPDGTQYASYATWECPINCIEPRLCPHTRDIRSWTMPAAAHELVASEHSREHSRGNARRNALAGPVIFHCTHRAYGVGMFDTRDVIAGDTLVRLAGERGAVDMLVGTVSHCHGAFNVLHVGE